VKRFQFGSKNPLPIDVRKREKQRKGLVTRFAEPSALKIPFLFDVTQAEETEKGICYAVCRILDLRKCAGSTILPAIADAATTYGDAR
jgi:hypothetical protein